MHNTAYEQRSEREGVMTVSEVEPDTAAEEGSSASEQEKMVIIAGSGDLDKAWPVLILATTGAAYGMDGTVFFTFWGLSILKRPDGGISGTVHFQGMGDHSGVTVTAAPGGATGARPRAAAAPRRAAPAGRAPRSPPAGAAAAPPHLGWAACPGPAP